MQGRYQDSFELYKQLIDGFGDNSNGVLSEAGYVCYQLGATEEAEKCFKRVFRSDPYHREALLCYLDMQMSLGTLEGVDACINRLLERYEDDPEAQVTKVRKLFVDGDEFAKPAAINFANIFADNQVAQLLTAKMLLEFGFFVETIELSKKNIDKQNSHPHFYDYYAKALLALNRFAEAEKIYEKMAAIYPDNVACYCGLANTKFASREYESAKAYIEKALGRAPENAQATYIYYSLLTALEQWEELIDATKKYAVADPAVPMPLLFHLSALGHSGRQKDVSKILDKFPDMRSEYEKQIEL